MNLTPKKRKDIIEALRMRINYIQTGDITLSSEEAQKTAPHKVKPLSDEQMKAILRMKDTIKAMKEADADSDVRLIEV